MSDPGLVLISVIACHKRYNIFPSMYGWKIQDAKTRDYTDGNVNIYV
jgi:hypothetical protein